MKKYLLIVFLLLNIFMVHHASAASLDFNEFRQLPVLEDGRVKPLESFARIELQRLSGADALPDMPAIAWLAEVLFAPDQAMHTKIIQIKSNPIQQMLRLPDADNQRYSYDIISGAFAAQIDNIALILKKSPAARTKIENDFVERYAAVADYFQLLNSLTLVLPAHFNIRPETAKLLRLPPGELDYLQLLSARDNITARLHQIMRTKGTNMDAYNASEQDVARLSFYLSNTAAIGENNTLFRVIPAAWTASKNWIAPWQVVMGGGGPQSITSLNGWRQLARAYVTHDAALWYTTAHQLLRNVSAQSNIGGWRLELEVWYHRLNLIPLITAGYALACLMLLWGSHKNNLTATRVAKMITFISLLGHAALVAARMLILQRPPVSSLYESMLFISLLIVAFGVLLARKHPEGLWIASFLGAAILAISPIYAPEGDTMGVLIAVLNTNFWLATHVVCITTGYSTTLIAGMMAHMYLWRPTPAAESALRRTALVALLFTAFGTMLGGIWADQSWGRFWGWDPKENGALLIVLWLVWVLHGRMTKHIAVREFAALLACANIVVALSWFGVNLLNVGLHSYGFTNSAAAGLTVFCGAEVILIAALYILARRRKILHVA